MRNILKKYRNYVLPLVSLLLLLMVCLLQLDGEIENGSSFAKWEAKNSDTRMENQNSILEMNLSSSHKPKKSAKAENGLENNADHKFETKYSPSVDNSEIHEGEISSEFKISRPVIDPDNIIGNLLNAYDVESYEQAWNDLERNLDEDVLLRLLSAYETEMTDEQRERTISYLMNAKPEEMSEADMEKIEAIISQEIAREDSNLLLDIIEKLEGVVAFENEDPDESETSIF